jgi:BA14K-like protein
MMLSVKLVAAALAVSAPLYAGAAVAAPITATQGLESAAAPAVETVQWRGGWRGRSWGFGPGLIAGAIIGGGIAAATSPWNGYNNGYYGGYPAYGYDGYAAAPGGYVTVVPGGGDPGYCARRFRSYDPGSGTYLGYDGVRHPCP